MPPKDEPVSTDVGPVTDQRLDLEAIAQGAGAAKPVEDEAQKKEETKQPDLGVILQTIADQQKQFGETLAELAKQRPVERIIERPVEREPVREEKPAGWRAKMAPGNDEIIEEAVQDIVNRRLAEYEKTQLLPALGHLSSNQERFLEESLARTYDDPQFGFDALRGDVETYRQQERQAGRMVSLETAYEKVSQREMYKAVRAAQAADRGREVKRGAPSDEGNRPTGREAPPELDAQEKQAAWAFFPTHPTDPSKPWTHGDAERVFLAHKQAAAKDRVFDKDEVQTGR